MCDNLPPGVSINDIPGNRPEDRFTEDVLERVTFDASKLNDNDERLVTYMIAEAFADGDSVEDTVHTLNNLLTRDQEES